MALLAFLIILAWMGFFLACGALADGDLDAWWGVLLGLAIMVAAGYLARSTYQSNLTRATCPYRLELQTTRADSLEVAMELPECRELLDMEDP